MPRTPLMHALRQFASEYAEAARHNISIDQVREERHVRLSRRQFLKGAGALIAGAALVRPLGGGHITSAAARRPRIGIVGAGIAGLHAALTLHDAGVTATVYEAAARVGGRMHTDTTTWADGQVSEWCGEFIDSGHETILGLLRRFGLKTRDRQQAAAHLADPQATLFFFDHYYLEQQAAKDFRPVYDVLQEQIKAAPFPTLYNSYTRTGYQLDHTSIYEWPIPPNMAVIRPNRVR